MFTYLYTLHTWKTLKKFQTFKFKSFSIGYLNPTWRNLYFTGMYWCTECQQIKINYFTADECLSMKIYDIHIHTINMPEKFHLNMFIPVEVVGILWLTMWNGSGLFGHTVDVMKSFMFYISNNHKVSYHMRVNTPTPYFAFYKIYLHGYPVIIEIEG